MGFIKNLPPFYKFRYLPKILSTKEKIWLVVFAVLAAGSLFYLALNFYFSHTRPIPESGGELAEGIVGEPRFLNPLLPQSDADRDLSEIIFSGLVRYDNDSQIVPDLAKSWQISPDGKTYTVALRDDVLWQDGKKFTVDDVLFTVNLAQNPDYKSPLRVNWQGVRAEKINDFSVKFSLPNPYAPFIENLAIKIIPSHIWANIDASHFPLADFNLKPVGTGPYLVKSFQKDKNGTIKSYDLAPFPKYFLGQPYLNSLKFIFFNDEESLIAALNKKTVSAAAGLQPKNLEKIKKSGLTILNLKMPRYYAVFFNPTQSNILGDKNVRLALNFASDKNRLVQEALDGYGISIYSPILPGYLGYGPDLKKYEYDPEKAKTLLENDGWKIPPAASSSTATATPAQTEPNLIRTKTLTKGKSPTRLEITLTIPQSPALIQAAALLREDWQKIGVKTDLQILPSDGIQSSIKDRSYEAIIFGEIMSLDPDPFPFWHSSQKNDPGLNLAMYGNKQADKLMEEARQTLKDTDRAQKYENFQKILIDDAPAVFLYSPDYIYAINKKINGADIHSLVLPSKRFDQIEKWYADTARVWK